METTVLSFTLWFAYIISSYFTAGLCIFLFPTASAAFVTIGILDIGRSKSKAAAFSRAFGSGYIIIPHFRTGNIRNIFAFTASHAVFIKFPVRLKILIFVFTGLLRFVIGSRAGF